MKATPQELAKKIKKAFGTETLNAEQLWSLVVFAKHVRLRARNNSAFNNLMNAAFTEASFRTVTKTRKDGSSYPGLEIRHRIETMNYSPNEEEEE